MPADDRSKTVLLIEDNPGDARLIQEMLKEARDVSLRVTWVVRLSAGLEHLRQQRVDAVLLDLTLPDSQGLETFHAVQAQSLDVPIVVLSGLDDEEVSLKAVRDGAQDYLIKGQVNGHILSRALRYAMERKRLEEVQRVLAEAGSALASSLDQETALPLLARIVVPTLADCCLVDVLDEKQGLRLVAIAHVDPSREDLVRRLRERSPTDPNGPHPVAAVLRVGEPMLFAETSADFARVVICDSDDDSLLGDLSVSSAIVVPLISRGRKLGAITLISGVSGRQFTPVDLDLAVELARRASIALDNVHLYRQAQEAIRLRDSVLSSVSHDLRNPLTVIEMVVDTVKWQIDSLGVQNTEEITQSLDRIGANTKRMVGLINELLDVAQLQMGRPVTLHRRSVDLVALVREMIGEYQPRTSRHRIVLDARVDSLVGRWDAPRLERVVGNLLSNAVKYSLSGGEVTVAIWREEVPDGQWAMVSVADHGEGIPSADLHRMFTWFYRGENVAEKVSGAGIGLAGSRQIVEQHGGTIAVESELGVGSTFTVRLPIPPPVVEDPDLLL